MKKSYYAMNAIMTQFVGHFDAIDIANEIVVQLDMPGIKVESAKTSGYVFKVKRDCIIDPEDIKKAIAKAMISMIDKDTDGFDVEIIERFEIEYDSSLITPEFVDRMVTIKKGTKEIYVEIDIV